MKNIRVSSRTNIGGRSYLPGDFISENHPDFPVLFALEENPPKVGENNTILIKYEKAKVIEDRE